MNEKELKVKDNKNLIGKRAKFKNNLIGYSRCAWNKKGVIVKSEYTPYLYLKFDKPIKQGIDNSMTTNALIICEGSINLI